MKTTASVLFIAIAAALAFACFGCAVTYRHGPWEVKTQLTPEDFKTIRPLLNR